MTADSTSASMMDDNLLDGYEHGLYRGHPPPSQELLSAWLDQNGAFVNPSLRITEMEDGKGWRITSDSDLDAFDLLFSIPKITLLSTRTSSLPPLPISTQGPITNTSILHFALCVLHEMRLGESSPWYEYLQSLPRNMKDCLLPMFWHMPELGGEDGLEGLKWLKGSEVERRIQSKAAEGLGYDDIVQFYKATSSHLPPTPNHPTSSPLIAFLYTYTLILTRAFVIDLYRPTALVPFADILNHSSYPHTSLASDEFVCHKCGSMGRCIHDILDKMGLPYRLGGTDLTVMQRHKMAGMKAKEDDTVELRAEREVGSGEEVWNSYGEIGDAGLLAEWGFIAGEYTGEGLIWRSEEIGGVGERWREFVENVPVAVGEEEEDDGQGLISPMSKNPLLSLSLSGQLSFSLFLLIFLDETKPAADTTHTAILEDVRRSMEEIELSFAQLEGESDSSTAQAELSPTSSLCVKRILQVLRERIAGLHKSVLPIDEILELRDNLPLTSRYTKMALTIIIDERSLLITTISRWEELLREGSSPDL